MSDDAGNWPQLDQAESKILGEDIKPTPKARWRKQAPTQDLFGLALSGGGIRSATFNLGLLQKLAELKMLDGFHYLSTVSGGGYLGGFWSAWQSRPDNAAGHFPAGEAGEEAMEVRHLREFSNFLRPRISLFSFETGRIWSGLTAALLPSITISLAFVLSVLLAWLGIACLLLGETPSGWVAIGNLRDGLLPALILAVFTLLVVIVLEYLWRRQPQEREALGTPWVILATAISLAVAGGVWTFLWQIVPLPSLFLLRPVRLAELGPHLGLALLPAVAWAVAAVVLITIRSLWSRRFARSYRHRVRQGALDRVLSLVQLCAVAWSVIGGLWVLGQVLAGEGVSGLVAALGTGAAGGGAFTWARKLLGNQPNKPTGGKLRERLRPWIPKLLAYLTLAAVTAGAVALLVLLFNAFGPRGIWITCGVCGVLLFLAAWTFDPHENGLHAFYRARLVRAYLGASNRDTRNRDASRWATTECEKDDIRLSCLPDRPLHLVCCAANDLSADPLGTLHRGADSAVLSKLGLQIGNHWMAWFDSPQCITGTPVKGAPKSPWLGSVMTASGAAFNSHMGGKSMNLGQAATFLLSALNLRLGLWLENPAAPGNEDEATLWTRMQRRLPGLLYFRELLGRSRARSTWVYLSDGGHFENLALYELVRRHCRYILLSDCGADPELSFDDFGNAVRRIREDFGVEIEIDLSALRPGSSGYASQPMVAGTIQYSEEDVGILLYLKPTLVGTEPPDVAQYARRNKDFPHETTIDQFYDEAQWESYRRLGEHITGKALGRFADLLKDAVAPRKSERMTRLFLRARYAWPPGGQDDPAVMAELDRAWTRLEKRVERQPALRSELLPFPIKSKARSREEELLAALPLVEEALRLMEAVFQRTGMAESFYSVSHPLYMGWTNRFGRWVMAPSFRAWWRWLAPLHSEPFVRFLRKAFDLPELNAWPGQVRPLQLKDGGYALDRWKIAKEKADKERTDRDSSEYFGYFISLNGDRELLAGVARVCLKGRTASWTGDDFYVAPGLWAVGIGESFLDNLVKKLRGKPEIEQISVGVKGVSEYWHSVYMGAGFERSLEGAFIYQLQRGAAETT